MKTLITLISALVLMSATVHADDIKKNIKHNSKAIATAPFVWGDPDADAPAELAAKVNVSLSVPVAPFVWGGADEIPEIVENIKIEKASVPVAPFVLGSGR